MPKKETLERRPGNTKQACKTAKTAKSKKKKQGTQLKYWFFTWNNYKKNSIETLVTLFDIICDKYVFQEETGAKGTPHLQGSIVLKKKMRWSEFKLPDVINWKKTRYVERSFEYCCKEYTRTGKCYMKGWSPPIDLNKEILDDEYNNVEWYDWQKEILDILDKKPDKRKIHWYWEKTGNRGKSYLAKYIDLKKDVIIADGKKADVFNQIKTAMEAKKQISIIIIDIPRHNAEFINYGIIEQIKNGHIYSGKYEGGKCLFKIPHVIIFANHKPNKSKLSNDRWDIHDLNDKEESEEE